MSDKEGEEDPKVISVGSFEHLRSYFDQKFSHLKHELSDNQLKSSSSLVKKLKSETNLTFKFRGNKKQFEFNTETLGHINKGGRFTGMLCAPSQSILSKRLSRDLLICRICEWRVLRGDGNC